MKFNFNKIIKHSLLVATAFALVTSCNKDVEGPTPISKQEPAGGQTLLEVINADNNLTIFKAAVARAGTGVTTLLGDRTGTYTVFAPTDAAFQAAFQLLGIPPAVGVNALRPGQLDTIVRYHIVGQRFGSDRIPTTFPNVQLLSQFLVATPTLPLPPGLLRMPVFPSKRGTNAWINNIPLTQLDINAANGVIHKAAAVLLPPSQFLWDRINTDANLTYLKAAIQRADEGVAAASTLEAALKNAAANLTVFAPNNTAFQATLTGVITQALIAQGVPPATAAAQAAALASSPAIFANPAVAAVLTPTTVRGIVVYHLFGNRAFSVNIPTTATATPTLLNSAVAAHPGVTIQATFGATGVTAATIKGLMNGTPSNILINPTPAPGGTSDQHYVNGVLHIIDQVLLPQ